MKKFKRILSLALILSVLMGLIMCIDISAASTSSNKEVKLIQAVVAPDSWGAGLSGFKSDKTIIPMFSGGPIGNSAGNYALAIFIVGKDSHWTVGDNSNSPIVFRMNMGWDSNATLGSNYYATLKTDASGKVALSKLSGKLTAEQLATYTSDIDTISEILKLAKDLDRRVEFRIWEKTNTTYTLNNQVESIWENDGTKTYLAATSGLKVDEYGGYQTSGKFDGAGCPVNTVDNMFQMTDAMFIEEDGVLRVSFNKVVQYGGRGNYCVNGKLAVVDSTGKVVSEGGQALSCSLPLETVCPWSAPSTVYSYKMTAEQVQAYNNLKTKAQTLGADYKLVYALEEINSQVLSTRGEATYNHFVDSIWADGYYPLLANACSKSNGVVDTAMQEIRTVAVDPQIKPEQCAKILSVTAENNYTYELTVTFDRPMNVDSVSLSMTYKADPSLSDVGYWQSGFYGYEYVTSGEGVEYKEVEGERYSNKVIYKFNQPMDYYNIPEGSGIRFMEYNNCDGAEKNNGIINPAYAHDEYGRGLYANVTGAGGFDLAWHTVSMEDYSHILLAASKVEENKVALSFEYPVAVKDASGIKVNGAAVASIVADNGEEYCTSFIATVNEAVGQVEISANALECVYKGTDIPSLNATVDEFAALPADYSGEFENGAEYSFMNTDTGREIILNGETDYALVKANGTNLWYLVTDNNEYVDLTGVAPKATTTPIAYTIIKEANNRYQITKDNGAVSDSDKNTGIEATLCMTRTSDTLINSGWYITKKGDTKPLKFLAIGDSNVYGTNPDLPAGQPQSGFRTTLASDLTDYFGRVVFVGNRKNEVTTLSSKLLQRHSAYPGYTVIDEWDKGGIGIQPLTDAIMTKYTPDVVLLSIGGNDCAYIAGNPPTQANMNMIYNNYEAYIKQVEAYLGENGLLFLNTMNPNTQANYVDYTKELFSVKLKELAQKLSDEGYKMAVGDNRAVLLSGIENGDDIMSSDQVHLSVNGAKVLANSWYGFVTSAYGEDSIKKTYSVTFEGEGFNVISSDNATGIEPGNSYSFSLEAKEGYNGTIEAFVNGTALEGENGVYSFKNILESKTVTVRGLSKNAYTITANTDGNGTATGATVQYGEDCTITITPNQGYKVKDVKVDGVSVGAVNSCEFANVTANHTIYVTFEKISINTAVTAPNANVEITPEDIFYGDSVEIEIEANTGYEVTDVIINGVPKGKIAKITINNVTEDIEVEVKTALKKFNVTVTSGEGGTATAGATVEYGDNYTVEITPNVGFELERVTVNDVSKTNEVVNNALVLANITADQNVEITFKKIVIAVNVNVNNATVALNPEPLFYGDDLEITVTPEEGYEVTELIVNGTSKGNATTAKVEDVTETVNVEVKTALKKFDVAVVVGEGGNANVQSGEYEYGTALEIKAEANEGFEVEAITVNGVVVTEEAEYALTVTEDIEIEISFKEIVIEDDNEEDNTEIEDDKDEEKEEPKEDKEENKEEAPKTGDLNITLILTLALFSLCGIVIFTKKKIKQ